MLTDRHMPSAHSNAVSLGKAIDITHSLSRISCNTHNSVVCETNSNVSNTDQNILGDFII